MEKLSVEYIRTVYEEYKAINKLSLHEIEFYEDGKKLDIDPSVIQAALEMAISPFMFINGGYYKNDWRKK
jgi:hypothetical protein